MQLKPNVAFCPVCRTPKSGNELVCSHCGSRACPNGHPMTSRICRLCGWEDRTWKPSSQTKTYNPSVQVPGLQKAPDAREDVCPQCKIRTVFNSGSCPFCGYIFDTTVTGAKTERPVELENKQFVVHQQFPGAHDMKMEYKCPRCGMKADPRTGNCMSCGYIGSMSFSIPEQQITSHEMPQPPPLPPSAATITTAHQQSTLPKQPASAQRDAQTRPCPSCGASVPVDSRYCWQCGNYCGAGRRSTTQSFPMSTVERTKSSTLASMSSPSTMYRGREEAAMPVYDTDAPPFVTTPRDIPVIDLEYPDETGRVKEKKKKGKKGEKRKEQAFPGEKKKFPTGLLAAIFVVAAALVAMVIFTVSQIVSTPSNGSTATPVIDTVPPQISDVKVVNVTDKSATVSWMTNEKAASQIQLCVDDTCEYLNPDSNLVRDHSVVLNDIKLDVMYKITIICQDSSGNENKYVLEQKFTKSSQPQDNTPVGLAVGNRAPDFTLKDLNGADVKLSSLRGKIVLLNFWRVDCAPCVAELPYLQQINTTWPGKPLEILCVNLGETASTTVQPFVTTKGYTFRVLLDSSGTVKSAYQVTSWPRTFFIDSNGIIKAPVKVGEFATKSEIEAILNSM